MMIITIKLFKKYSPEDIFIDLLFLEREEGGGERFQCEKETLTDQLPPVFTLTGDKPKTWVCGLIGN